MAGRSHQNFSYCHLHLGSDRAFPFSQVDLVCDTTGAALREDMAERLSLNLSGFTGALAISLQGPALWASSALQFTWRVQFSAKGRIAKLPARVAPDGLL